jgi:hypothetical protein
LLPIRSHSRISSLESFGHRFALSGKSNQRWSRLDSTFNGVSLCLPMLGPHLPRWRRHGAPCPGRRPATKLLVLANVYCWPPAGAWRRLSTRFDGRRRRRTYALGPGLPSRAGGLSYTGPPPGRIHRVDRLSGGPTAFLARQHKHSDCPLALPPPPRPGGCRRSGASAAAQARLRLWRLTRNGRRRARARTGAREGLLPAKNDELQRRRRVTASTQCGVTIWTSGAPTSQRARVGR